MRPTHRSGANLVTCCAVTILSAWGSLSFAAQTAYVQPPQDPWEINTASRPSSVLQCSRIDLAYVSPVVVEAQLESIRLVENSPLVRLDQRDAFRLLGLPDPGTGTALIELITRAISAIETAKQTYKVFSRATQERLAALVVQRENPTLEPYLVRATGHDVVSTTFEAVLCGDTLWAASRSPNFPDTTVQRLPLVVFLERQPTELYLERLIVGRNPAQ